MSIFDDADVKEFLIEASELFDSAEDELLKVERGESTNFYDSIFRVLHSVKGGSGMLGLNEVQTHMHKVESQWSNIKGRTQLSRHESSYFLDAIDSARKMMSGEAVNFDYDRLGKEGSSKVQENSKVSSPEIATAAASKPKSSSEIRVYAVDDEPEILQILQDYIEEDSFSVSCFNSADELFEACLKSPPQIVLTDFKMPVKSGIDVLDFIKGKFPEVPVIMISGFLTKEVLVDSLKFGGFYGALEKPFKQTDVLKMCWAAYKHHELQKMIKKSLNLLIYQFSDLEKYLTSQGKGDIAATIGKELKELIALQKGSSQFKA